MFYTALRQRDRMTVHKLFKQNGSFFEDTIQQILKTTNITVHSIRALCSFHKSSIPLTNRVRGPYSKLRTEFFPVDLLPKREARGPQINGKKRGSVTYSTDRENKVSKIFIISLRLTGARARKLVKVKRKVQLPQRMSCQNPKN